VSHGIFDCAKINFFDSLFALAFWWGVYAANTAYVVKVSLLGQLLQDDED